MKVLLRHVTTGLFCGDAFLWVKDVKSAKNFETQESASRWIASRQLSRVEIVMSNGEPAQTPTTPLTPAKASF
jgi:hypothetical protein